MKSNLFQILNTKENIFDKKNDDINKTDSNQQNMQDKIPKVLPRLTSVPMENLIGEENSFFNAIIHMLYFTPEILQFLKDNLDAIKEKNINYEIFLELYEIYVF